MHHYTKWRALMLVLLRHKFVSVLAHLIDKLTWPLVFGVLAVHFTSTWLLMRFFEPESKIAELDVFWWYYVVTATTIGYGDYTPVTLYGRFVGLIIMIAGIALLGGIIGKIASVAVGYAETRRKGMAELSINNHVVVVGRDSQRTMDLLRNLLSGTHTNIVLVSDHKENPLNGSLAGFVAGSVDNDDVQRRACLSAASTVIIIADDDLTAVGKAVAVVSATSSSTRVIVFFQDRTNALRFGSQSHSRVRCIFSVDMAVMVQEAEDPGAADFVSRLLDNTVSETFGRCVVPAHAPSQTYEQMATKLVRQKVAVLGLYRENGQVMICPDPDMIVDPGDCVAIASSNPARCEHLVW